MPFLIVPSSLPRPRQHLSLSLSRLHPRISLEFGLVNAIRNLVGPGLVAVRYSTVQIFSDRIRGATAKSALILLVLLMDKLI
jgi:hypothetical protein